MTPGTDLRKYRSPIRITHALGFVIGFGTFALFDYLFIWR